MLHTCIAKGGKGLAGEGWDTKSEVIAGICTEFIERLFEAVVKSV